MSKKNESENYDRWTKVWGSELVMDPQLSLGTVQQPNEKLAEKLWSEGGAWDSLSELAAEAPSGKEILEAGIDILTLLLHKNISYGNSAIEPLRLFSNASVEEQIMVRIDDKLSRLKNNQEYPGDNDIDDLIGYLILLKVVRRKSEG